MAALQHTGLTPEVLTYKAPDAPVPEREQPKDRAFFADPKKTALLSAATRVRPLTPYIGTELVGVQLSQLTDAQKDELALLAAEVPCPNVRAWGGFPMRHDVERLIPYLARGSTLSGPRPHHRRTI